MNKNSLKYISDDILENLRNNIVENKEIYTSGNFIQSSKQNGWSIELNSVSIDYDKLSEIDNSPTTPKIEIKNSVIIHNALIGLTRSMAKEERIWVRLTHLECIEYCRKRWLDNLNDEKIITNINAHFFSRTLTDIRDHNAISRLWWNYEIAKNIDPINTIDVLNIILSKADIRQALIERTGAFMIVNLGKSIIELIRDDAWLTEKPINYRVFMKKINLFGSGMLLESMNSKKVNEFTKMCLDKARIELETNLK